MQLTQKGVYCNCFTSRVYAKWNGEQHFFMNRANKKEGACLYNKRLTSTLNTLCKKLVTANLEAVEGANDRSKYMFHDKLLQSVGIECAILTIGD